MFSSCSGDDTYRSEFKVEGLVFHFVCALILPEAVILQKIALDQKVQQMLSIQNTCYMVEASQTQTSRGSHLVFHCSFEFALVLVSDSWDVCF